MAHLTLAGLSDDGKRLLLVSDKGVEFTLDVDARLRAALRGEHARLGQLEIQMDSALRPRDIQARIRAGETPEAVAQAAQTIARPDHAVRRPRAGRAPARRRPRPAVLGTPHAAASGGSHGGARTLGDVVAVHLRSLNVDPAPSTWDAWRREDGRWTLTGDYAAGKRSGSAAFAFDAPGNYVIGRERRRPLAGRRAGRPRRADRSRARRPDPGPRAPAHRGARRRAAARRRRHRAGPRARASPAAWARSSRSRPTSTTSRPPATCPPAVDDSPAADVEPEADAVPDPEPAETSRTARRPAKKKGRASVPSWDEIMFGGGKSE